MKPKKPTKKDTEATAQKLYAKAREDVNEHDDWYLKSWGQINARTKNTFRAIAKHVLANGYKQKEEVTK